MCLDICNRSNIFADIKSNLYVHCNQVFLLSSISLLMVQILTILAIQGGSPSPFDRSLATKVPINDGSLKSFLLQMLDNCKHIFHYTDFALTAWGKGS